MIKVQGAETGFKGKATISAAPNHFPLDHTEELGLLEHIHLWKIFKATNLGSKKDLLH